MLRCERRWRGIATWRDVNDAGKDGWRWRGVATWSNVNNAGIVLSYLDGWICQLACYVSYAYHDA